MSKILNASTDFKDIHKLAHAGKRELTGGSLQSLLTRRIGFPMVNRDGKFDASDGDHLIIVQTLGLDGASAGSINRVSWLYVEWLDPPKSKSQPKSKSAQAAEDAVPASVEAVGRVLVAYGTFNLASDAVSRVEIRSVALGSVDRIKDADGDQIRFLSGALVGRNQSTVYKCSDIDERRFYGLTSGFTSDGRNYNAVFRGSAERRKVAA